MKRSPALRCASLLLLLVFVLCGTAFTANAAGGASLPTDTVSSNIPSGVTYSSWAGPELEEAYSRGLISRDNYLGDNYISPINREQFARMTVELVCALEVTNIYALASRLGVSVTYVPGSDQPKAASSLFSDTDSLYVELAAKLGIVEGYEGLFQPERGILRCEAAAMLRRCLAVLGVEEADTTPSGYQDAWDMPRWSVEHIKFVSGRTADGLQPIMGGSDGRFDPKGSYSIEQAILTMVRCADSLSIKDVSPDWREADGYDTVSLTMSFGGDCTLGRDPSFGYSGSFDQMYDLVNDPSYFFSGIREFFTDDLTMVNFEGTLTTATSAADKAFVFKGRPEYARILTAGSIDAVTLANNHSRDYLQRGFEDTVKNLSPYVAVSGYDMLPIVTVKGVKVGLASNTGWSFNSAQKQFIENAITNLRARGAEIIIFNFHWGVERAYSSNATQQKIAHYAIDCGADLVIGHHPHVVQEVETYKGKQIAYSLGNLVFGGNKNPSDKNCLIFQQTFTLDLDTRQVTVGEYRALPYRVSSVNNRNDYHPVPA